MRILIFHGYLLGGTGSNVYTSRLAAALVGLGHEVHLLCQDRHPEECEFVDAYGDWDAGELRVRTRHGSGVGSDWLAAPDRPAPARPAPARSTPARSTPARPAPARPAPARATSSPARCTVYRPDIGRLLPVYVADRYEGIQARPFSECTDEEIARYIDANVAAVREVAALVRPDVALANHLVMGPVILARGLSATPTSPAVPSYAVKVHGSALEYTVKPEPERFLPYAREGLARARGVLVGSRHTAESLWRAVGDPTLESRTRLGPPGVDVERFRPRERADAAAGVEALARRLAQSGSSAPAQQEREDAFARDESAAGAALERLDLEHDRLVAFVGKLIAAKGVDLLLAAWPLVLARVPHARLAIVGFGAERERMEAAAAEPAAGIADRVVFTGRLDHDELAELLPACEALVVPSTFPEAFGMVAVEAAACGALPISAAHSGLAEVSTALAQTLPAEVAPLLSFPIAADGGADAIAADGGADADDDAVTAAAIATATTIAIAIADRIVAWLRIDDEVRARTRARLVETVRERWSWQGVARGVIAAARGELDELPVPPPPHSH